MKKIKIAALIVSLGCGLSTVALADDSGYSSSQTPATTGRYPGAQPNSGYGSSNQPSGFQGGRVSQDNSSSQTVFYSSTDRPYHQRHAGMHWVRADGRIPRNAVAGGYENNGKTIYICQAPFHGGVHPGKLVGYNCNIGYAGREIIVPNFQVLTSSSHYSWTAVDGDQVPVGAFQGGHEHGRALYICQTRYAGGVHPGKVVDDRCNITYAGREVAASNYDVLMAR